MNAGHIHLILNHAPIFGVFVGAIIFGVGMFRRNNTLEKTGLITFIVTGIATLPTYFTGEGAEEAAERFKDSSHDMIHEHEELAETGLILMIALAIASLILLIVMSRSKSSNDAKHSKQGLMKSAVLSLAATTFGLMMIIGNTGGKIRRPELRGDVTKNSTEKHLEHQDID
jgi:uncharacterized membrane protein